MSDPGDIQEIASCINVLRPDEDRFAMWLGAMRSGDFKFGYGLLRSADDEYDPFGVLAAISFPSWTWDDAEEAWAVEGEALFLQPTQLAEWLGIRTHPDLQDAGIMRFVDRFQRAITTAADGASSFAPIALLLERGMQRSLEEHLRNESLRQQRKRFVLGPLDRVDDEYATYDRSIDSVHRRLGY